MAVGNDMSVEKSSSVLDLEKGAAIKRHVENPSDDTETDPLLSVASQNKDVRTVNSLADTSRQDSATTSLHTVLAVTIWYASNIGLLLLNKWLLTGFGFKRPVFLTLWHMICCSIMSTLIGFTSVFNQQQITSWKQFYKVSILALVFCLSVVLGNISLRYIPVSFSQAIGATTPLFTAVLALLFYNRERSEVYLTLIPVVVGIVIATGAEPSFHMVGFVSAITATAARAFKSILQGMLLVDPNEKLNSMNLLRYMTPIAALALMVLVSILEPDVLYTLPRLGQPGAGRFYIILGFNGFLAFFVNLCNFLITRYTSALTMQVIGNLKGVVATIVSILVFHNAWTYTNMMGYAITVSGVVMYMQAKRYAAQKQPKADAAVAVRRPVERTGSVSLY